MPYSFEIGPIRPPSESNSLLIRCTRNCPWNKCKFCVSYRGKNFEIRPVEEIKQDIDVVKIMRDKILEITYKTGHSGGIQKVVSMVLKDPPNESFRTVALWLMGGAENVFLQDANSIAMKTEELGEVIVYLKQTFPKVNRVTSYGRSQTASKKKVREFMELRQAGLSRIHIGLESGYDPILEFMGKGEDASQHIKGGRNVVESGISLSEYVILGLGGRELSAMHAHHTAAVLNEIGPEFIRVRTLMVNPTVPLAADIASGRFARATDEDIIQEERSLIEHLNVHSNYISDHVSNLLPELEGQLPGDKKKLISIIDSFLALAPPDKANFTVGRRVGLYKNLNDMLDSQRYDLVEQIKFKLTRGGKRLDPQVIFKLMEEFL
jgi:histone acetyltransferase (RNA polymerase elongator complex component)